MHVADCAPAIVFGSAGNDVSPAEYIHGCFSRELRRQYGRWSFVLALAGVGLWAPYVLGGMLRATWLNGGAIRRRTGKSIVRQMCEQGRTAMLHAIPPRWYYTFELFDDGRRRRSAAYLQRGETKRGAFLLLKHAQPGPLSPLTDKVAFAARCSAHHVRAIPVLFALQDGAIVGAGNDDLRPPAADLFVKPNHGKGGRGAESWLYRRGRYEGADGAMLSEAELLRHLRGIPAKEGLVVQPRRVNHAAMADLNNGALATVRVVTCRNEHGRFEATNAVLRMAQGRNHVVDNFHAGGLAAKVDVATGTLGLATDLGVRPGSGWRATHPNSGARIADRVLPCWDETVALAVRAHAAFADRIVIGWDVGIMPDGPELVEGNGGPDLDIIQRTHREPIGDARLGQLLAFHLRRLAAERDSSLPELPLDQAS
jgi:putative polysaccharide biosynthesis protein